MIDDPHDETKVVRCSNPTQPAARETPPPDDDDTGEQEQPSGHRWVSSLPQVASEDVIAIGNGRYAHFRRDRRFAQVQVTFSASRGIDPNPGRELTDQFKELGWRWREQEPGKPWIYQLDKSSEYDLTARGDSRDALHEQFLIIIEQYRQKHGLPPTSDRQQSPESDTNARNTARRSLTNEAVADQTAGIIEKQKLPSPDGETRGGQAALQMLDAFVSVGAERFDLTFTDAAGEKVSFRGNRTLEQLRPTILAILQEAAERQHNVIVRPRSSVDTLIQLDDLDEEMAARLLPVSFLTLQTSPGSFQSWVAVADADAGFARRLRKGVGADLTASGATRVSGSVNFKTKYAPIFPRVETIQACPGLVATRADLKALGVVAPQEKTTPTTIPITRRRPQARGWPNYQRCVENAPPARGSSRPDISRADYTFCLLAIDWGWTLEETAARLMRESAKASANGEGYALHTARAAAATIERRGERRR